MDGDGDITRPENVTAFRNFILESTERRGLHLLMADGVRLLRTHFLNCRVYLYSLLVLKAHKKPRFPYQAENEVTG